MKIKKNKQTKKLKHKILKSRKKGNKYSVKKGGVKWWNDITGKTKREAQELQNEADYWHKKNIEKKHETLDKKEKDIMTQIDNIIATEQDIKFDNIESFKELFRGRIHNFELKKEKNNSGGKYEIKNINQYLHKMIDWKVEDFILFDKIIAKKLTYKRIRRNKSNINMLNLIQ